MSHELSPEQQAATPKELIGVYVKVPGRKFHEISLATLERLKSGDIRKALENLGEGESYSLLVNRGFDYSPELDAMKQHMNVILNNAIKHVDRRFAGGGKIDSYELRNLYAVTAKPKEKASSYYKELANHINGRIQEYIKKYALSSPEAAYDFANEVVTDRWEMGEDLIAESPKLSYKYASVILKGKRFPKGEDAIARHPGAAALYAINVMKEPFPEGEDAIAKNAETSYEYSRFALGNRRFLKGEPIMAESPEFGYKYAAFTLKGRFFPAEDAIASDPEFKQKYEERFGIEL